MSSMDSGWPLAVRFEIAADFGADAVHRGVLVVDGGAEGQIGEDFAHGHGQRASHPIHPDGHRSGSAARRWWRRIRPPD
jgi:hypothetical protein